MNTTDQKPERNKYPSPTPFGPSCLSTTHLKADQFQLQKDKTEASKVNLEEHLSVASREQDITARINSYT
jgi:hypothetical protein